MKLALGTVQFGLSYGVSNKLGQPSIEHAHAILDIAKDAGITTLDTALGYGESHQVLASYSSINEKFNLVTKLPPLQSEQFSKQDVENYIALIDQCFLDFNTDKLHSILFHQANDIEKQGVMPVLEYLQELQLENKLSNKGVSLYSGAEIESFTHLSEINLVQIPYNAFDTYFKNTGTLSLLSKKKTQVHARSCFLQGLLLMPINELASYFEPWKQHLISFHLLAQHLGVSALTLSLAYALKEDGIDKVVVGVNTESELEQILEAYQSSIEVPHEMLKEMTVNDPGLTNPANWKL
ncbi:aldo/keto reductase [Pseudoalteromonas sp. ASV78]|uniref:aldo/keto reductase n=1 Tax=Pseudoalteromonas sp. ASV78 TaxID=3397851 RepID=UPI0039FBEFB6